MPLRDAFAVLFFVSVGMLLDPSVFASAPLAILATVGVIVLGKSTAAWLIVRAFGHPNATALTIAASLAQIGELSFILIGLGTSLDIVPRKATNLILAGAIVSILVNPFLFKATARLHGAKRPETGTSRGALPRSELSHHDIVVGYGRVGSLVGAARAKAGAKLLVIVTSTHHVDQARRDGAEIVAGNAATPAVLAAANLAEARRLFITIPEVFEAGQVVQQARAANPSIEILARAHSDAAVDHLSGFGANLVVSGEREIAERMLDQATGEWRSHLTKRLPERGVIAG
jgi:CPA2 family monovalent cation:H+ antiporter-2